MGTVVPCMSYKSVYCVLNLTMFVLKIKYISFFHSAGIDYLSFGTLVYQTGFPFCAKSWVVRSCLPHPEYFQELGEKLVIDNPVSFHWSNEFF